MVSINGRRLAAEERPYLIAEVGINARTDIDLAKRFINVAADAGADAVKFQTHLPDAEMIRSEMEATGNGEVYDVVSGSALSRDQHIKLQDHCVNAGVDFLSTPFSVEGVDLLDELGVPAIKIGSGELTNYPLLERAAEVDVPLLVSTGMSDYETVAEATEFLKKDIGTDNFALLYCVSEYPTDPTDFELGTIRTMHERFDVPVGFSDHSTGIEASVIAMARGSAFIEKHFTIDRRLPGPDQEVSIEPDQLAELSKYATYVNATRGNKKHESAQEREVSEWARHSVVTTTKLNAGDVIRNEDITTKRPGTGIPAHRYYDVIGMSTSEDISANSTLYESHLNKDLNHR